jgi:hypothetical protein
MRGNYLHILALELVGKFSRNMPADSVVGAERITETDDETAKHGSSLVRATILCSRFDARKARREKLVRYLVE